MANYTLLWILTWLCAISAVTLATNSTDTSTTAAPVQSEADADQDATEAAAVNSETTTPRPDLHLSLSPSTIGGLAAAGAVILMIVVSCMVFMTCICIYQVCTCFD